MIFFPAMRRCRPERGLEGELSSLLRSCDRENMTMLDVIIVGAGAAGLSAALAAHNQGLSYIILEQRKLANTIFNMPKRKRVFDTPAQLPRRGEMWLRDSTR